MREWATAQKAYRLAMTSASGCRARYSQTMGTAALKSRSNVASTSGFLFMETA